MQIVREERKSFSVNVREGRVWLWDRYVRRGLSCENFPLKILQMVLLWRHNLRSTQTSSFRSTELRKYRGANW